MRSALGRWGLGGKSVEQGGKRMPAKSSAQKRLMDAAAHNPDFADKAGIPVKVAKEFSKASKGMTFAKGGEMRESKAMARKEVKFMKAKGAPKSMVRHEEAEMRGMKAGGRVKQMPTANEMGSLNMRTGGLAAGHKAADGVAKRGKTRAIEVKMAKGGRAKKFC